MNMHIHANLNTIVNCLGAGTFEKKKKKLNEKEKKLKDKIYDSILSYYTVLA